VTERLKVLASKASVRETVPWVRIPPSPPLSLFSCTYYVGYKYVREGASINAITHPTVKMV
jgi:hypothetical protein